MDVDVREPVELRDLLDRADDGDGDRGRRAAVLHGLQRDAGLGLHLHGHRRPGPGQESREHPHWHVRGHRGDHFRLLDGLPESVRRGRGCDYVVLLL